MVGGDPTVGVPHIALEDTILADEVQNVRAFGSENMLEGGQNVVNQRLSEMASKIDDDITHYHRIVIALHETIRIMREIDEVIDAHGGWPDAFQTAGVGASEVIGGPPRPMGSR